MPNSTASAPIRSPLADFHPGHGAILEPPEGPKSALACTCGSLLELNRASKAIHMSTYRKHLAEVRDDSPLT